jgi:hypothetical protein
MNEPRDYSVEAEPATEHLKNALQLLRAAAPAVLGERAFGATVLLQAAHARIVQALALLERPQ